MCFPIAFKNILSVISSFSLSWLSLSIPLPPPSLINPLSHQMLMSPPYRQGSDMWGGGDVEFPRVYKVLQVAKQGFRPQDCPRSKSLCHLGLSEAVLSVKPPRQAELV